MKVVYKSIFPELIAELQGNGLSLRDQAKLINCPVTTIHKWTKGAMPRFDYGFALLQLYSATVRQRGPNTI